MFGGHLWVVNWGKGAGVRLLERACDIVLF